MDLDAGTLTNDILSLEKYGMLFYENKLTVDLITDTLHNAQENSKQLFLYQWIDFQSGNVLEQFIDKIDSDLLT